MQQMAYQQQQQQQQQQHQQQAVKNKKLAGISPVAAKSPKAMELQKLQMEKMKQAMENQMNDLQRTGRSALSSDHYQIESILTLFGISQETLTIIIDNFTKNNIKDKDLKNLDLNDEKLLKKLIPNFKDNNLDSVRKRFITWIRYDIKQLHIHENSELDEKKQDLNDSVITLNISGTKYTTLKSTLINSSSTYFKKLIKIKYSDIINDDNKKKNKKDNKLLFDSKGAYFIDRDGNIFELVLNYMQTGKLILNYNKFNLDYIKKEFKFYGINFPKDNKLPIYFRFEYVAGEYYLNLDKGKYDCMVSNFRIFGPNKKSEQIINKVMGIEWPKSTDNIEEFLNKRKTFTDFNYKMIWKTTYKCNDKEHSKWTVVEYYQKYVWCKK
eukprot:156429_1